MHPPILSDFATWHTCNSVDVLISYVDLASWLPLYFSVRLSSLLDFVNVVLTVSPLDFPFHFCQTFMFCVSCRTSSLCVFCRTSSVGHSFFSTSCLFSVWNNLNPTQIFSGWVGLVTNPANLNFWVSSRKVPQPNPTQIMYTPTFHSFFP